MVRNVDSMFCVTVLCHFDDYGHIVDFSSIFIDFHRFSSIFIDISSLLSTFGSVSMYRSVCGCE